MATTETLDSAIAAPATIGLSSPAIASGRAATLYCIDVLTQISAVQAALDKVALGLLDGHARHCVVDGRAEGTPGELTDELMAAVGRLMRRG